ncbi:MAG: hypothetical protein ACI4PG_10050 [Candidatus Ventricola sp.]
MHEDRVLLRRLLRALLAERPDCAGLYIPRGEAGMIRMIRALLDMRPQREDDPLAGEIEAFCRTHERDSAECASCKQTQDARVR